MYIYIHTSFVLAKCNVLQNNIISHTLKNITLHIIAAINAIGFIYDNMHRDYRHLLRYRHRVCITRVIIIVRHNFPV